MVARKKILLSVTIGLAMAGCGASNVGNKPKSNQNKEQKITTLIDTKSKKVAYACIDKNDKLVYVGLMHRLGLGPGRCGKGGVAVLVRENGFSPNFDIPERNRLLCQTTSAVTENDSRCGHRFIGKDIAPQAILADAVGNAFLAAVSFGVYAAATGFSTHHRFKINYFTKILYDNKLPIFREYLMKARTEQNAINSRLYKTYLDNAKNISLHPTSRDKTKLFVKKHKHPDFKVSADEKHEPYVHSHMLQFKPDSNISNLYKKDMDMFVPFLKSESVYANYWVDTSFTSFDLNKHIQIGLEFPAKKVSIPYKPNIRQKVPINYSIKYANVKNIIPKSIILKDKNIIISFLANGENVKITFQNLTGHFLSINSLASYVGKDVQNFQNWVNLEIPPNTSMS